MLTACVSFKHFKCCLNVKSSDLPGSPNILSVVFLRLLLLLKVSVDKSAYSLLGELMINVVNHQTACGFKMSMVLFGKLYVSVKKHNSCSAVIQL